jgi:hypothetical protein
MDGYKEFIKGDCMDNLVKITTKLMNEPTSYVLTLNKQRLEQYYTKKGSTFRDEFALAKIEVCSCVHMNNLVTTYGVECIQYFLDTFFGQKVG